MARIKVDIVGREATYTCLDLKAGMPLHAHGAPLHHTRCDEGEVVVLASDGVHRLKAGEILRFDSALEHAVVPLTVGARFTNVCAHDMPEWHGEMDMEHRLEELQCAR